MWLLNKLLQLIHRHNILPLIHFFFSLMALFFPLPTCFFAVLHKLPQSNYLNFSCLIYFL